MDHVFELLLLGVGLLITVIYILSATGITRVAMRLPEMLAEQINRTTEDISEAGYLKYCHDDVSGSDVVSAIRKYKQDAVVVEVTIYTSPTQTATKSTLTSFAGSFQNLPTNEFYINPASSFRGKVTRNANDVIEKLIFTQNTYVAPVMPSATQAGGSLQVNSESEGDATFPEGTETPPEIIFSDENSSSGEGTEGANYLKRVQDSLENYSSDIDDALTFLDSFSFEDNNASELVRVKELLVGVQGDLAELKSQCSTTKAVGAKQRTVLTDTIAGLQQKVSNALTSIDSLQKELTKYEDTNNSWFIGYPVKSKVRAELSNGVLTIKGNGRVDVGTSLPKWSKKSLKITKVVFDSGVRPESIDYWFDGCSNLKSVNEIPASVSTMNGTFRGCNALTGKITIKSTVVSSVEGLWVASGAKSITFSVKKASQTAKTLADYLNRSKVTNVKLEVIP